MKEIVHQLGIRERACRITRVRFRPTTDNEPAVYITVTADNDREFSHDQC